MMRIALYAGTSVALAAGVIVNAFIQRPNFYSAAVYLSQSNACLMTLTNFVLVCAFAFLFGLERLFYGPLRPIEIEQIYERSWFAVTETCLAMTIFRDEIGAWFLVMFTSLLFSKVWGWIAEGRVEFLGQQPPANPRLYHTRLVASLFLSVLFNASMFDYCVYAVMEQVRPGMMIMFAFEYMILLILSFSTSMRYGIAVIEMAVIRRRTKEKLEEKRADIRRQREAVEQETVDDDEKQQRLRRIGMPEDIDENEIDVPGWEEKGQTLFILDMFTDAFKLIAYSFFFFVIMFFHGLPIHIIRDVYLTLHSFIKRVRDYIKYRTATKDMDERYPNATQEELERENTCIICREEMRPAPTTQGADAAGGDAAAAAAASQNAQEDRQRPKKLPCGHILHLACLKSWLERQQVCPTCRRPVLVENNRDTAATGGANGAGAGGNQPGQPGNGNQPQQRNVLRQINFGRFRIRWGMARGNQEIDQMARELEDERAQATLVGGAGTGSRSSRRQGATERHRSPASTARYIEAAEASARHAELQIMRDIRGLELVEQQMAGVRELQGQLARLRIQRARETATNQTTGSSNNTSTTAGGPMTANFSTNVQGQHDMQHANDNGVPGNPFMPFQGFPGGMNGMNGMNGGPMPFPNGMGMGMYPGNPFGPGGPMFGGQPHPFAAPAPPYTQTAWGPGTGDPPTGFEVPPGWTIVPLQRLEGPLSSPTTVPTSRAMSSSRASSQHRAAAAAGLASTSAGQQQRPSISNPTADLLNSAIATQQQQLAHSRTHSPARSLSQQSMNRRTQSPARVSIASGQHQPQQRGTTPLSTESGSGAAAAQPSTTTSSSAAAASAAANISTRAPYTSSTPATAGESSTSNTATSTGTDLHNPSTLSSLSRTTPSSSTTSTAPPTTQTSNSTSTSTPFSQPSWSFTANGAGGGAANGGTSAASRLQMNGNASSATHEARRANGDVLPEEQGRDKRARVEEDREEAGR